MIDAANDADLLTVELQEAAATAAAGVCLHCDDALDPEAPAHRAYYDAKGGATKWAVTLGPRHPTEPYHLICFADAWGDLD